MKIILNTLDFHVPSEINGFLTTGLWKKNTTPNFLSALPTYITTQNHFNCPHLKVARLDFLGGIPPKFERQLRRREYSYGKKVTTAVLYKDETFLWSEFSCNRSRHSNVMTPSRFSFILVFLCTRSFLKKSLTGVCTCHNCLSLGKVWTNSMRAFWKYFEMKF